MIRIAACLMLLTSAISAQQVLSQSLVSDWYHTHTTPYWTDNVPTTESTYGVVDQLNYIWWLEYFSPTINLPAGTYAARARVKKLASITGVDSLTLSQNGTSNAIAIAAVSQPVDQWVWTPDLVFTIPPGGGSVAFRLHNLNGNQKQNYWFDEFEIREPDWEVNKPEALSHIDGAVTNGFDPAIATACAGGSVALTFVSVEVGQPWDFGYAFVPALPGSATGIQTTSGQQINVDLGDPSFQYFNGGGFTVPFTGAISLPITAPLLGVASMQSAHVAPAHPDGFALSQGSQLDIVGSAPVPLTLSDDSYVSVNFQDAPYCSGLSGINFYGTTYTSFYVTSNGHVQFSWPSSLGNANLSMWNSWMPRAGMWTNLAPNAAATVTVTGSPTDVRVEFNNVASQAVPNTVNSVAIAFDATGATIIDTYAPDPGHTSPTILGITRGSGSMNPGPVGGLGTGSFLSLMGAGLQVGSPNASIYEEVLTGAPAGGWTSLVFPTSDGNAFIVN